MTASCESYRRRPEHQRLSLSWPGAGGTDIRGENTEAATGAAASASRRSAPRPSPAAWARALQRRCGVKHRRLRSNATTSVGDPRFGKRLLVSGSAWAGLARVRGQAFTTAPPRCSARAVTSTACRAEQKGSFRLEGVGARQLAGSSRSGHKPAGQGDLDDSSELADGLESHSIAGRRDRRAGAQPMAAAGRQPHTYGQTIASSTWAPRCLRPYSQAAPEAPSDCSPRASRRGPYPGKRRRRSASCARGVLNAMGDGDQGARGGARDRGTRCGAMMAAMGAEVIKVEPPFGDGIAHVLRQHGHDGEEPVPRRARHGGPDVLSVEPSAPMASRWRWTRRSAPGGGAQASGRHADARTCARGSRRHARLPEDREPAPAAARSVARCAGTIWSLRTARRSCQTVIIASVSSYGLEGPSRPTGPCACLRAARRVCRRRRRCARRWISDPTARRGALFARGGHA